MLKRMKHSRYNEKIEEKNRHGLFFELLAGAAGVLVLYPSDNYYRPQKGEFKEDMRNLCSDFQEVGDDMRVIMREYESSDYCRH